MIGGTAHRTGSARFKARPQVFDTLRARLLHFLVRPLRAEQLAELLRALPKAIRRELMPFPPKIAEILRELRPGGVSLTHDLSRFILQRYGVQVPVSAWQTQAIPAHLRPRIEVVGPAQQTLGVGRDLGQLRQQLEQLERLEKAAEAEKTVASKPSAESPAWARLVQQWERFGLTAWNFGDLEEMMEISRGGRTLIVVVEASRSPPRIFSATCRKRLIGPAILRREKMIRTTAKRNSFQAWVNCQMITTAKLGAESGSMIYR